MPKKKMPKKLPFHIQHNTTLTVVAKTLQLAADGQLSLETMSSALGYGKGTVAHIVPFLRQMGILEGWRLGEFGERLRQLMQSRPDLLAEAMHVHLYTLHWLQPDAYFSFAYATICDWLWERGVWKLEGKNKAELVGIVTEKAAEKFGVDASQIAFSIDSVRGALNWLKALSPSDPIIRNDEFSLRSACPVQTLLWSVDALYHHPQWHRDYGVRIALDEERRTQLCKICLVDSDGLEKMLEFSFKTDRRLNIGTEGGFGRWLSLTAPIPVGML